MTVDGSTRVARHPGARSRHTLAGTVVLGPGTDEFQVLEPPGDAIWAAIAEPISVDDLVALLGSVFDTPVATVRADVVRFLGELLHTDLAVAFRAGDGPGS